MAMYYCHDCDKLLDDDYHPCTEHPQKHGEIVCPDCALEWEDRAERMEEEINGEDYIKPRPKVTPLQQPPPAARMTFPAVGDTQTYAGERNGIWYVWTTHGANIGRVHQCNDRDAAIQAFDANSEVLKLKMSRAYEREQRLTHFSERQSD